MVTYKLHIIRHGLTSSNKEGRYIGRTDIPLCDEGRAELLAYKERFSYPEVGMVVTSPLSRCVETAGIIYPMSYTERWEEFIELSLGEYEGKTHSELADDFRFFDWISGKNDTAPPGGERSEELCLRLTKGMDRLFKRMMEEKIKSMALVTHGGVISTLIYGMGLPKMRVEDCLVGNGRGFTLLLTPELWMRDRAFEVFGVMPHGLTQQYIAADFDSVMSADMGAEA